MAIESEPAPYPGLLLHRARIAAGVKLRAAARAAGCSHTLLSLIETGKRRICLAAVVVVASHVQRKEYFYL